MHTLQSQYVILLEKKKIKKHYEINYYLPSIQLILISETSKVWKYMHFRINEIFPIFFFPNFTQKIVAYVYDSVLSCFTQQYILELISYQYLRYFLLLFYVGELWKEDFNKYVLIQKVKKKGIGHSLEKIVNKLQMTERKHITTLILLVSSSRIKILESWIG